MGLISEKTEVLYAELNERAEAATGSYSVTGDSLQYIYSVPVSKNHRNIRSRCLVHEFSFTDIFNDINHGYRAAILKKNFLWLLPFYMVVATYFYYEKIRKTMRTAIVSNLKIVTVSFRKIIYYSVDTRHYKDNNYCNCVLFLFRKMNQYAEDVTNYKLRMI